MMLKRYDKVCMSISEWKFGRTKKNINSTSLYRYQVHHQLRHNRSYPVQSRKSVWKLRGATPSLIWVHQIEKKVGLKFVLRQTLNYATDPSDQQRRSWKNSRDYNHDQARPPKAVFFGGFEIHDDRECWKQFTCQMCGRVVYWHARRVIAW